MPRHSRIARDAVPDAVTAPRKRGSHLLTAASFWKLRMSSSISSRHSDVVSMLIVGVSKSGQAAITPHLGLYATSLLEQLVEHRCSVRPLRASEGYRLANSAGGRIRRRRTHRLPTFANGDDNRP